MEFDHVGRHCEVVGCRQKDFLPFKCPSCARQLCLEHRRFEAHGCTAPDATSMDCPICHKSIKMDRSADPNLIWDQHFASSCSQQQPKQSAQQPLMCGTCRVKLGPSNTFHCNKCGAKVCMSHRMPEDHNCTAVRRSTLATRSATGTKNSRLVTGSAATASSSGKKPTTALRQQGVKKKEVNASNTLAGTAQRRADRLAAAGRVPPTVSTTATSADPNTNGGSAGGQDGQFACPMCGTTRPSLEQLTRHIEADHLVLSEDGTSNNNNDHRNSLQNRNYSTTNSARGSAGQEVCPQCGSHFADVSALIRHVESAHSAAPVSADTDKGTCVTH